MARQSQLAGIPTEVLVAEVNRRFREFQALTRLDPTVFSHDRPTPPAAAIPVPKTRRKKVSKAELLKFFRGDSISAAELGRRSGLDPSGLYTRLNGMITSGDVKRTTKDGKVTFSAVAKVPAKK